MFTGIALKSHKPTRQYAAIQEGLELIGDMHWKSFAFHLKRREESVVVVSNDFVEHPLLGIASDVIG